MDNPIFDATIITFRYLGWSVPRISHPSQLEDFQSAVKECNQLSIAIAGTFFIPAVKEVQNGLLSISGHDNKVFYIKSILTSISSVTDLYFDAEYNEDATRIGSTRSELSFSGQRVYQMLEKCFRGVREDDDIGFNQYVYACWHLRSFLLHGLDAVCILMDIDLVNIKTELGILSGWKRDYSVLSVHGIKPKSLHQDDQIKVEKTSHAVICLFHYYNQQRITQHNASSIAATYGHCNKGSGGKLYEKYQTFIGDDGPHWDKYLPKNLEIARDMLTDPKAIIRIEKDIVRHRKA